MATLLDLANKLEARVKTLETAANEKIKAAAIAVLRDLVQVTPVDTSKALSNWQVGLGVRPSIGRPAFSAGKKGSTRSISAEQAISVGTAEIMQKLPGQSIFISNLTPYIADLDQGKSTQFAGGFSARAAIVARSVLRQGGST